MAAGEKGVRVIGYGGNVVDALLLTVKDIFGCCFRAVQVSVDDDAVAGAGDDLGRE